MTEYRMPSRPPPLALWASPTRIDKAFSSLLTHFLLSTPERAHKAADVIEDTVRGSHKFPAQSKRIRAAK